MRRIATILLILGSLAVFVVCKFDDPDDYYSKRYGKGSSRRHEYYNRERIECPEGMHSADRPHVCEFTCLETGVNVTCKTLDGQGCACPFERYYNTETKSCSYVECPNLDCIGRENEAFYHCESGSRESCLCSKFITLDCRTGCQCKNGFCREGKQCVPRKCEGSPFSKRDN